MLYTSEPFDDGHRFVVGVRILIPAVAVISGVVGALTSSFDATEVPNFLYPAFVYFSVRAAIVGYLAGFLAATLAVVVSRWSRVASGVAAAAGVALPFLIVDQLFSFPEDFLGGMPPVPLALIIAIASGIGVALLPHPTLHIEWATIIGREKHMLFTRAIEGERTSEKVELSRRLDEWDPIGVYDFMSADQWPQGEYDDLVEPILEVLRAGVRPHELAPGLVAVFKHDYGLDVPLSAAEPFAASLVGWHNQLIEKAHPESFSEKPAG
ncbi:MAG: hypothetical protein ACOH1J_06675 [Microbacteriaceae bacterium]